MSETVSKQRRIRRLTPAFDPAPETRLGLISLASDEVCSDELRRLICQAGVAVFETRIANSDTVNEATLRAMAAGLSEAAGRLPGSAPYAAVGYLCTSASMLIGSDGVADRVNAALPGAAVTNPMLAGLRACETLGVTRIGLVTPYVAAVTAGIAAHFETAGLAVPRAASFFTDSDARVARISARALSDAVQDLAEEGGIDAVFLSCTALRTVDLIAPIEERVGLPVLSSNTAVGWDLLRLAGRRAAPGHWGRLISRLR